MTRFIKEKPTQYKYHCRDWAFGSEEALLFLDPDEGQSSYGGGFAKSAGIGIGTSGLRGVSARGIGGSNPGLREIL